MKKIFFTLSLIIVISLQVIGCTKQNTDNNTKKSENTETTVKISESDIPEELLLTNSIEEVKSIYISYKDTFFSYTNEKDKSKIKLIFDSIMNTKIELNKNPDEIHRQYSDPLYTLEISYNNGNKDVIKSTETGELIYKLLDENGSWIGGKNKDIKALLK